MPDFPLPLLTPSQKGKLRTCMPKPPAHAVRNNRPASPGPTGSKSSLLPSRDKVHTCPPSSLPVPSASTHFLPPPGSCPGLGPQLSLPIPGSCPMHTLPPKPRAHAQAWVSTSPSAPWLMSVRPLLNYPWLMPAAHPPSLPRAHAQGCGPCSPPFPWLMPATQSSYRPLLLTAQF